MTFLLICWGIDAVAFLAAIHFFGKALLATNRLDAPFFMGWLVLIIIPYASISTSYWFNIYGYNLLAYGLAAIAAIPATLYILLLFLLTNPEPNRNAIRPA